MANFKKHLCTGAAVGAAINIAKQLYQMYNDPNKKFSFGELAGYTGFGAFAGVLPDLLEPATNPIHRKVFHSIAFGAGISYGAFGSPSEKLNPEGKTFIRAITCCYLSHLLLDGKTPKGLPII